MNRFLITSLFTLALMVGATGAASSAHAATCVPGYLENTDGVSGINPDGKECTVGASSGASSSSSGLTSCPEGQTLDFQTGNCVSVNGTVVTQGSPPVDPAAAQTPTVINQGSSDIAFNPVMSAIAGLFAWLVGVAALTLDYAVYYTVVNMGAYISKLTAIGVTWRILRDIGNIMLIFGFLAIGISVILNTERIGYGKKMLPMLLVAAVFLNFSLFFSEAIIDTGNLFATQFYTQINGGVTPTADTLKGITQANDGISSKLMSQLGLVSIYDVRTNSASLKGNTPWYIGFLAILLFIVTAFVMFSLAFILIARFIVLVFLIILAPIGFAGLAVPQLARKAGQWWSALFEQTITAPVLLLLLYVALAVITDAQFLTGLGGGYAGAITGFVDNNNLGAFASYVMSFSIAIGLMLAVTISAKSLSAFGASKATALAGKLTFGATAWGMRSTVGAGSQAASQFFRRTKFGATKYGRVASMALDKGAKASFDVRGATAFGGLKGMGVDAGDAQKGGYREKQKKTIEGHKEYAKSLTEAIGDRGPTRKEKNSSIEAGANHQAAEDRHTEAEHENVSATQQRDAHKAEVDRLAEELRRDRYLEHDPNHIRQRDAAAQNLAASETNLAAAAAKLAQAAADLEKAKNAKTDADTATMINIKTEKTDAQKRYAGSIDQSPIAWGMYGSGGSKAAKNIRAEANKSEDQKLLDALKKALNPTPPTTPPAGGPVTPPPAGGHP